MFAEKRFSAALAGDYEMRVKTYVCFLLINNNKTTKEYEEGDCVVPLGRCGHAVVAVLRARVHALFILSYRY